MEKEYLNRKANSSTTKHSFGSGLLGKGGKFIGITHTIISPTVLSLKSRSEAIGCQR